MKMTIILRECKYTIGKKDITGVVTQLTQKLHSRTASHKYSGGLQQAQNLRHLRS